MHSLAEIIRAEELRVPRCAPSDPRLDDDDERLTRLARQLRAALDDVHLPLSPTPISGAIGERCDDGVRRMYMHFGIDFHGYADEWSANEFADALVAVAESVRHSGKVGAV